MHPDNLLESPVLVSVLVSRLPPRSADSQFHLCDDGCPGGPSSLYCSEVGGSVEWGSHAGESQASWLQTVHAEYTGPRPHCERKRPRGRHAAPWAPWEPDECGDQVWGPEQSQNLLPLKEKCPQLGRRVQNQERSQGASLGPLPPSG